MTAWGPITRRTAKLLARFRMSTRVVCTLATAWVLLAALGLSSAHAAMTLETCNTRKAAHATLVAKGVPATMAKGPEWARTNLGAEQLKEILTFIQLEEDMKFRCDDIFAKAEAEAARKTREALRLAAKRAGIKVPPIPTKNPERRLVAKP